MKDRIKKSLQTLAILPALVLGVAGVGVLVASPAVNAQGTIQDGADSARGDGQQDDLFGTEGVFRIITNVLLFIIGAVAVIMLIIGGIRYVVSAGDQSAVTGAKNTILYAVVGIVVALLAYAVVNFVLDSFVNQ